MYMYMWIILVRSYNLILGLKKLASTKWANDERATDRLGSGRSARHIYPAD